MPGNDGFTKLLLHCNGTDGSTTFTDDSASAHTVTPTLAEIDTAQSVFGGASGLFDGTNTSRLSIPDSDDWHFGSGDFTVDFRVRFANTSGTQAIVSQWGGGGSNGSFYIIKDSGQTLQLFYSTNGGSEVAVPSTFNSFVVNTWYHVAVVRDGNTLRFFVDGAAFGTGDLTGITFHNSTRPLNISTFADGSGQAVNGWVDEVRISKGIARWTAPFTPPTEEYDSGESVSVSETINLNDTVNVTPTAIKVNVNETVNLNDTINLQTNPQQVNINETINLNDSLIVNPNPKSVTVNETINLNDNVTASISNAAPFISTIISFNPLIFVTDDDPARIVEVDVTTPGSPIFTTFILTGGAKNAKDVAVDNDFAYIACADGLIIKVDLTDFNTQSVIDLSDTDDLLTIESLKDFSIIYAGTENTVGELYMIDNRETEVMDSDFQLIAPTEKFLETDFNLIEAGEMDSDFQLLSEQNAIMDSDFKLVAAPAGPSINPIDNIIPLDLKDYVVFINGVALEDTDLTLDSIIITHTVDEESIASFRLSRNHDKLNTTLEGVSSEITNQNSVRIEIDGNVEFDGNVSRIDAVYDSSDHVLITARAPEKICQFNNVNLSLPGVCDRLSIYDVLIQSPSIINPIIDPSDENPVKFKGIRVDLGEKREQSLSRLTFFDSLGNIATSIQNGTFVPSQNHTYFWSPTATKFANFELGEIRKKEFLYIGTSLSPVSEDLWNLDNAKHRRQRIFDDIITPLGTYEVGVAPFKEISLRNGIFIPKFRWVDEADGLYSIRDAAFNFEDYAKTIADLEYEKILNINGNIFPDTTASIQLTIDGYYYFGINPLSRINIDNTTEVGIYKDNNGFPVAVKSISITSVDRKVTLACDNIKSTKELETIDGQFPDEDDEEFNESEERILIAPKTSMKTGLPVE